MKILKLKKSEISVFLCDKHNKLNSNAISNKYLNETIRTSSAVFERFKTKE